MSKFNEFEKDMGTTQAPSLYTGLAKTRVLGINPTTKQLAVILNSEEKAAKFNTDYAKRENEFINDEVRPICIWVQDIEGKTNPTLVTIELGAKYQTSQNGNFKIINSYLQNTWAKSVDHLVENQKMDWFSKTGIREARNGEFEYYTFLARVLDFNFGSNTLFDKMLEETGVDYETVFKGDFKGLHNLVEYLNDSEKVFAGVFMVKEKKNDDGGVSYYQEFAGRANLFYNASIKEDKDLSWQLTNMQNQHKSQEEAGYKLLSRLYTFNFMPFVKANCFNAEPEEVAVDASAGWPTN